MNLAIYFADIESRIDVAQEQKLQQEWMAFASGALTEGMFIPQRTPAPSAIEWPEVNINAAFEDVELMIYFELKQVSDLLASRAGMLLNMRPNYGTGIIPSMFGAEIFKLSDSANTLPGTKPLPDAEEQIPAIVENPVKDYETSLVARVFDFGHKLKDLLQDYPKMQQYVHVYNPDLQGPFSICDMLWGSDIYMEFFEEDSDTLPKLMQIATDTIIEVQKKWHALFPPFSEEYVVDWGMLHRGHIIIRNDAVVNISAQQYHDFVRDYDQQILNAFGGAIHFCGRCDHAIAEFTSQDNFYCLNMSQPELNDMDKIYQHTTDKGFQIIGMPAIEYQPALDSGREFNGKLHIGASLAAWEDMGE